MFIVIVLLVCMLQNVTTYSGFRVGKKHNEESTSGEVLDLSLFYALFWSKNKEPFSLNSVRQKKERTRNYSGIIRCKATCFLPSGWGTDEGAIVSILAHRNAKQRSLIRQTYAETYGEDLLKALDKELSSDFEVGIWNRIFIYIF